MCSACVQEFELLTEHTCINTGLVLYCCLNSGIVRVCNLICTCVRENVCMCILRLQILMGTKFAFFVCQLTFSGINFIDLNITFGANVIIFSDFRSISVMFHI